VGRWRVLAWGARCPEPAGASPSITDDALAGAVLPWGSLVVLRYGCCRASGGPARAGVQWWSDARRR